MISDSSYIEAIKNCSKWNNRILGGRRSSKFTVFDQQTGVMQRPTEYLYRKPWQRLEPSNPMQVYSYPPQPWLKSREVCADAVEMKYFIGSSPALSEAVNVFNSIGQNNTVTAGADGSGGSDTQVPQPELLSGPTTRGVKFEIGAEPDISEYDLDEPENDPSDEDEWGSRRKKKRTNPGLPSSSGHGRPGRRPGYSAATGITASAALLATPAQLAATTSSPSNNAGNGGGGGGGPDRPFGCQVCGARYKSRPGLAYHRVHVHNIEGPHGSSDAPKSPSTQLTGVSPPPPPSQPL